MRSYCYYIIVFSIMLIACQKAGSQSDKHFQSLVLSDYVLLAKGIEVKIPEKSNCDSLAFPEHLPVDILRKIMPVAKGWLKYYGLNINDFSFRGCSPYIVDGRYFYPMDSVSLDVKNDRKRSVYSFSPNNKRYIDIYYYASYDNERKAIYFDGEIDQGVWLYDLEQKMGYMIEVWGTSGATEDSVWLDNDRFVLLQNGNSEGLFLIEIFDIKNQIKSSYATELKGKEYYVGYYVENAKKKGIKEYE